MSSNPVREWGDGLLVLGALVAVFAIAFAVAQQLLAAAGPRTYGFMDTTLAVAPVAVLLLVFGGVLRGIDYLATSQPRRLRPRPRPR